MQIKSLGGGVPGLHDPDYAGPPQDRHQRDRQDRLPASSGSNKKISTAPFTDVVGGEAGGFVNLLKFDADRVLLV